MIARWRGEGLRQSQTIGVIRAGWLVYVDVTRLVLIKWGECDGENASITVGVEKGKLGLHCSSSYPWIGTRGLSGRG